MRWLPCVTSGHQGPRLGGPLDLLAPAPLHRQSLGFPSVHIDVITITVPVTILAATEGKLAAEPLSAGGLQSRAGDQAPGVHIPDHLAS